MDDPWVGCPTAWIIAQHTAIEDESASKRSRVAMRAGARGYLLKGAKHTEKLRLPCRAKRGSGTPGRLKKQCIIRLEQ